jgi:AcrR family transcriptional regulator
MPRTTRTKPTKTSARSEPFDLKESCLVAAREVIADAGVEALSMREVARKLGISHQAPYRHFESRDHLLAEIMRRCFADFAAFLDARKHSTNPDTDLHAMGNAYMDFAASKPLEYRLMFGTPWPEPAKHPELVRNAVHAFDTLRMALRRKHGDTKSAHEKADLDALFIWSTLHGMASISHANVMKHLNLSNKSVSNARAHIMKKMSTALADTQS